MKLKQIHIRNFRSLRDVTIPFQPDLTLLIGENDAGKSSVLDILGIVLEAPLSSQSKIPRPEEADFFQGTDGELSSEIVVELSFEVSKDELEQVKKEYIDPQGLLHLRATYHLSSEPPKFEVKRKKYKLEELNLTEQQLRKLKKSEQERILQDLGLSPSDFANSEQRIAAILKEREIQPTTFDWAELSLSKLKNLGLPQWDRYRALDYKRPERLVDKTMKTIFAGVLAEADLQASLKEIRQRAERSIQKKVQELEEFMHRFLPRGKRVDYVPNINFSDAFKGGEFRVDKGQGLHYLSRVGDGTKRRMLMAVMEWDRTVQREVGTNFPTIRGYDEPDSNLHPSAQRQFIHTVKKICEESSQIQIVLCTHSVFMVNAVPISSIVHLKMDDQGCTTVETFDKAMDEERKFLENVAAQLGVTNSVLFFDRCYLLVEGETEYFALPILYRALYGRSLAEDGIALINLKGEKSAASLFRLLGERRAQFVIFLLDTDVANQRREELRNQEWPEEQVDRSIISIGESEFEDIFTDEVWAKMCEKNWPRQDGTIWEPDMIKNVREGNDTINTGKFSEDLKNVIRRDTGMKIGKPEMGQHLAEYLARKENLSFIPEEIRKVFERARQIAGVEG